tara:strand:- start:139 stop:366 length:228 start_codon:yes stop_codon:yes gene_type:complete
MKHREEYLTEEEIKVWKDRAFRLYKEAEKIVTANPKNYDQNLVFKLMSQEQACLDRIRVDKRARALNNLTKIKNR